MARKKISAMARTEKVSEAASLGAQERIQIANATKNKMVATPVGLGNFDTRKEITHSDEPGYSPDIDPSHADTLKALGYSRDDIALGTAPSNKPLTVQELEDRKAKGESTDINADVMRRYSTNDQGVIPAHVLGNVFQANAAALNANVTSWPSILPEHKPATAPVDRAGHPGRVVHDPWASDPAGPNEALNASQAREMFEDNADTIAKDNESDVTTEY
jgi:hypothetical protein